MTQGQVAELQARNYLVNQGLTFVDNNVRYPFGEIDLVMRHGDCLVFIEVKYRASDTFGGAISALSHKQIVRLRKAANHYLQVNRIKAPCRFDLIAIDKQQIRWLKDAF